MTIQQISVFLENTSGRLAEVTKILGVSGVNLRAITIADTADFGILRLIVDDVQKALTTLEEAGFTAKVTEVIGVEVEDKPGGLSHVMEIFEKNNVNIEYLYATLEKNRGYAIIIFRVEDIQLGLKILEENDLKTIGAF